MSNKTHHTVTSNSLDNQKRDQVKENFTKLESQFQRATSREQLHNILTSLKLTKSTSSHREDNLLIDRLEERIYNKLTNL